MSTMNIQNIASITKLLVATGFHESIGYRLLQHICFKPAQFILTERVMKENDVLTCSIHFEREGDEYICSYYDACFLKEIKIPDAMVAGVDLRALDECMMEVDWQMNSNTAGSFNLDDETSWQREKRIERIITDLLRLSATEEGKRFADALKLKHWIHIPLHPLMGNLNAIRSRFEVCQRFYFFDGQGISVEESYRFLLNRWLEKKVQAGRKQSMDKFSENSGDEAVAEKGLLQKRKSVKAQKIKR